ncbi:MAG: hypothetical protein EOO49_17545, partial [Flavobacterium sp.]
MKLKLFVLLFLAFCSNAIAQVSADCATAVPICGNISSGGNVNGPGQDDFNGATGSGCLGTGGGGAATVESNSAWYTFTFQAGGQFGFNIDPNVNTEDWDWALYGPFTTPAGNCPGVLNMPVRCDYSGSTESGGYTGVGVNPTTGTQTTPYEPWLNVNSGETYLLLINNFSATNNGFTLQFSGQIFTNFPDALDCSYACPLSVPTPGILCASNPTVTVNAQSGAQNPVFTWYDTNGNVIPGETGSTLDVTVPGTYSVDAEGQTSGGQNCESDAVTFTVTEYTPPGFTPPTTISACNNPGPAIFNLNSAIAQMGINPADFSIQFYDNYADAANVGATPLPNSYAGANNEIVYISLEDVAGSSGCIFVSSVTLVYDCQNDMNLCDALADGVENFDLTTQTPNVLGSLNPADYTVTYHNNQGDATSGNNPISPDNAYPGNDGETIYVHISENANPGNVSTTSFLLHLLAVPVLDPVNNVTACDTYTLPALSVGNYFNSPNGVGPITGPITASQTVYVYAQSGTTPNCTAQSNFTVTIVPTPQAQQLANVTACDTYTLQPLAAGETYNTAANGSGTAYVAGNAITTTTTLFVIAQSGTTPNCSTSTSFTITINPTPQAQQLANVTACNTYTLQPLAVGEYYNTAANGSGTNYSAGNAITATTTLFVIAETGTTPNCSTSTSFTITINSTPAPTQFPNVSACDTYTLQPLAAGETYNTASDGTGTAYVAGNAITATTTLYVIAQTGTAPNICSAFTSFTITINPTPQAQQLANVTACDTYTLQPLAAGETYNTAANGSGTAYVAGNAITATTTLFVIAQSGTTPNCSTSTTFTITINPTPQAQQLANVTACDTYTLQPLAAGETYNTAANGSGTAYFAGNAITATTTLFVIAQSGTTPNCSTSTSFTITINPTPQAQQLTNVTACDTYTLQPLAAGEYYNTAANGSGTNYSAGNAITATTTLFVIAETGTTPNCSTSTSFTITINSTPAPTQFPNVTACDTYALQPLAAGETYNTASNGTGTAYVAGNAITATTTLYVIAQTGTAPNICSAFTSFTITINPTPQAQQLANVTACDTYTLQPLAAGETYNTAANGSGTAYVAGNAITATTTLFVIAQSGTTPNCSTSTTFTITINPTPQAQQLANVTACDTYTLQPLAAGETYNTAANGSGTAYVAGNAITVTTTLFVIAQSGTTPNCSTSTSFTITINPTPQAQQLANVTACDTYTLQPLAAGEYYNTASDGTGTNYSAGNVITNTITLYVVAESNTTPNCTTFTSFTVTINITPQADAPANVSACQQYALPALTVGQYFNGPNGTGGSLSAGTVLTASQTVYVYAETGTTPNCSTQNSFTV